VVPRNLTTFRHWLEGQGWVQSHNGECEPLTWQWTRFFSEDFGFSRPVIVPAKVHAQLPWQTGTTGPPEAKSPTSIFTVLIIHENTGHDQDYLLQ
jgi:hypothetical protein